MALITASDALYLNPDNSPTTSTLTTGFATLIDGNFATEAVPFSVSKDSIGIDLGSAQTVAHLRHYDGNTPNGGIYAAGGYDTYDVYYSSDNSTWTFLEQFHPVVRTNVAGNVHYVEVTLATPTSARYWKLHASAIGAIASSNGTQLNSTEMEAYDTQQDITVDAGIGSGEAFGTQNVGFVIEVGAGVASLEAHGDTSVLRVEAQMTPRDGIYLQDDETSPTTSTLGTGRTGFFDSDLTTEVEPGVNENNSTGIDLGARGYLQSIRVYDDGQEGAGIGFFDLNDSFEVYGSNDNATWTLLKTVDPLIRVPTGGVNDPYYMEVSLPALEFYRYFKCYANTGAVSAANFDSVNQTEVVVTGIGPQFIENFSGIASAGAMGVPNVAQVINGIAGIAGAGAFGAPVVRIAIAVPGIASAEAIGGHTVELQRLTNAAYDGSRERSSNTSTDLTNAVYDGSKPRDCSLL